MIILFKWFSPLAPIAAVSFIPAPFVKPYRYKNIAESGNMVSKNAKCFALKNYFNETFIKFVRLTFYRGAKIAYFKI